MLSKSEVCATLLSPFIVGGKIKMNVLGNPDVLARGSYCMCRGGRYRSVCPASA